MLQTIWALDFKNKLRLEGYKCNFQSISSVS